MAKSLGIHWLIVGIAAAAALPAAYTLDPCLDNDSWWHMATGRWIVQHREVPWLDPFSQMSHETPTRWYAYSWLYDIYLFEAFNLGSYRGIMAVRTLMTAASTGVVFALLVKRRGSTPLTLILTFLLGMVLMMFAKERPWHFTIAFTAVTLWAVQNVREACPIWKISWLPILFAVWANLHIQFVLGWLVLGIACSFPGMAKRKHLIVLFLGCLAATAINPYHVHLVEVILEYATQTAPLELVQELAPPEFGDPSTWATLALLAIGFAFAIPRRDGFAIAMLIIAAILAMRMRRDIWFAAVAVIATLPAKTVKFQYRKLFAYAGLAAALTFVAFRGLNNAGIGPSTDFERAQSERYPVGAYQWYYNRLQDIYNITDVKYAPPVVFNDFNWGGYLIWKQQSVIIDGRTNLYGEERLHRTFNTWNIAGDCDGDPDFLQAGIVIAPKNCPLTDFLRSRNVWKIIYEDDHSVLFSRCH